MERRSYFYECAGQGEKYVTQELYSRCLASTV